MHRKESGKHQFDIYHFVPNYRPKSLWARAVEYFGLGAFA